MAAKGSRWSDAEVECLLEIWSDTDIQHQLEKNHKNSEVFGKIRDYLVARGYHRTIEQCRDKVKKLRFFYNRVRHSLRKSGSTAEEKDKFPWYDAVDQIIGRKTSSQLAVVDPNTSLECPPSDEPGTPSRGVPCSWSKTEIQVLLALWASPAVQQELLLNVRNYDVYASISAKMASLGFDKAPEKCRDKIKKLKHEYKKIKSGNEWFDIMHEVLGARAALAGCSEEANPSLAEPSIPTQSAVLDVEETLRGAEGCFRPLVRWIVRLDSHCKWSTPDFVCVSTDDCQWLDDEVQVLMTLWAQPNIQKQLLHTATAHQVFTYLSNELTLVGFNKSPHQCSVKVSNLMVEYKKIKQAGSQEDVKSGWFVILDGILNPDAGTLMEPFSVKTKEELPDDEHFNEMSQTACTSDVKVLLSQWTEDSIQEQLRSTQTTDKALAELSSEVAMQGFYKSTSQCQEKVDHQKRLDRHKPKAEAKLVAKVTGSGPASQLPGCRLSMPSLCLLVPTLHLMCAFAWQVVQSCNVVHYGKVEELVKLVTELAPELLTTGERVQLLLRLRARHVLELCLSESTADLKNIEPHLNVIQDLTLGSSCDHKEFEELENAKSNFVDVVHALLEDTKERLRFFKEVFPFYYGQKYQNTLCTLLWKFISKLDDLLPIPDIKQTAEWLSSSPTAIEECGQLVLEQDQLKALLHFQQHHTGDTNKCFSGSQNRFLPTMSIYHTNQPASEPSQDSTDDEDIGGFDYEDEEPVQENRCNDERPLEDCDRKNEGLKFREGQSHGMTSADNTSLSHASFQLQTCSLCTYTGTEVLGLLEHIRKEHLMEDSSHHPSTASGTRVCALQKVGSQTCTPNTQSEDSSENSTNFVKDQSTPNSHNKTRTHLFPCDKCDKKYSSKRSLIVHYRIHTGDRRYKCHICGTTAVQHPTLVRHMRMHRGEKNYLCTECGKAFLTSGELRVHTRVHTGERPYTCKHCGKGFIAKSPLTIHTRQHTGERPYRCFFCPKSFRTFNARKKHIKIHSRKKSLKISK
ncbi:uncharacterized protein KZ484_018999 isoform 2-T2 [Pholidichthys leucotaenia]